VLVVSNYTLIGNSLVASLQSLPFGETIDAKLCQTERIVEVARAWEPQAILIEATVDFPSAIASLGTLLSEISDAHVVLLGREADEAAVYEAVFRGADGYLTGDASLEYLASTLTRVAQGELGLSPRIARQVIGQLRQAARARPATITPAVVDALTPREQEVFDLVRRGLRSREIAQQLTIAEATVYKHIQNILDKLRVHSRTQAVLLSNPTE
jgi:two-component system NarL family response regulator